MVTTTIPVAGVVKELVVMAIIAESVCPSPFGLSNTAPTSRIPPDAPIPHTADPESGLSTAATSRRRFQNVQAADLHTGRDRACGPDPGLSSGCELDHRHGDRQWRRLASTVERLDGDHLRHARRHRPDR